VELVANASLAPEANWEAWAQQRAARHTLSTAHIVEYNDAWIQKAELAVKGLFDPKQHKDPMFRVVSVRLCEFIDEYKDPSQFWTIMGSTNIMASVQEALSNTIARLNESIGHRNVVSMTHDLAIMEKLTSTVEHLFFIQTHLIEWAQSVLVVQALGAQDGSECPAPASLQDLNAACVVGAAIGGSRAISQRRGLCCSAQ